MSSRAAQCLKDLRERILGRWVDQVRKVMEGLQRVPDVVIRNDIPALIDKLVVSFEKQESLEECVRRGAGIAYVHGEVRAELKDYWLDQVSKEYALLRRTIIDVLREKAALELAPSERDILDFYIDDAIHRAIVAFDRKFKEINKWSEQQVQRFFELSVDLLAVSDESGYFKELSHSWEQLLGWSRHELSSVPFQEFIHPDDVSTSAQAMKRVRGGETVRNFRNRYRRKDGSYTWLSWTAKATHGLVYSVARDIQLEKRLEEERRLSSMRIELSELRHYFLSEATRVLGSSLEPRAILNGLADLSIPRLGDYCLFVSVDDDRFEQMAWRHLERDLQLRLDPEVSHVISGMKAPQAPMTRAYMTGKVVYEPHTDQNWRKAVAAGPEHLDWLNQLDIRSMIAVPAMVADQRLGVLMFGHGASERRHTRDDVELAEEVAKRAAIALKHAELYRTSQRTLDELKEERKLRERFVATLTHDLRTPLTVIRTALDVVARGKASRAQIESLTAQMFESIDRMDQMIQDLLDVGRIRAGEPLPLNVTLVKLNDLVRSTVAHLRAAHGDRFELDLQDEIEGRWDVRGIRRVLENLCENAIKYGYQSTPVTIATGRQPDGQRVWFSVHNRGEPIAVQDKAELFTPFRRAVTDLNLREKGWGLGLSLVSGITHAHGGSVEVESEKGWGTKFTVSLPLDGGKAAGDKSAA